MNEKKYENCRGVLKFINATMYEGVMEVYISSIPDTDVKHCLEQLHEEANHRNISVKEVTARKPISMSSEELMVRIMADCHELKLRGDLFKLQPKMVEFMLEVRRTVVRVDLEDAEMALVESGRMISAIKAVRARTGIGLKDAKDKCDAYRMAWEKAGKPVGGLLKVF